MIRYILIILISFNISNAKNIEHIEKLVWPPAPDEARIEYVSSVRKSDDLGIEKGFFSKIYDFIFGEEDSVLSAPFGIYADKNRVFVTDIASKSLYIFDKEEDELIVIEGSDDEKFAYPIDVVSDHKGRIYVSDSVRAKIYVFDEDGDYSHEIALGVLKRPVGIAISADSKSLYIVDAISCQIHVTTLNGKFLKSIGKRGDGEVEFNKPTYIDVAKDGNIYISDSMNHRVHILDKEGNFVRTFGKLSKNIGGFVSPRGISLDSDDNVYVTDTMFNSVQIFNKYGEVLMKFGSYGRGKGEFALVEDVSITQGNMIYIADVNNKCIKIFKRLDPRSSK